MSEKEYDMEEQDKLEEQWIPAAIQYLERKWFCKCINVREQHLPYDLICCGTLKVDIKTDTRISDTKNFFIETESVKGKKKGWLYNTDCDYILYIDVNRKIPYLLNLALLRDKEQEIKKFPYREILNKGWITCGHLVPVSFILRIRGCRE